MWVMVSLFFWEWTGYFFCNETGTWTFSLSSDDGSFLWMGDTAKTGTFTAANCLIDNSGNHPVTTKTNTISLVKDVDVMYPIRIQYGELNGGNDIIVSFIKPSGGTTINFDGTV